MRTLLFCALVTIWGMPSSQAAPVPKPKRVVEIPKHVVEAIVKLGGRYGYLVLDGTRYSFFDRHDPADPSITIPAFQFHLKDLPAELPPIPVPFGMDLSSSDVTHNNLPALVKMPNLTAVILNHQISTAENLAQLTAAKNLIGLSVEWRNEISTDKLEALGRLTKLESLSISALGSLEERQTEGWMKLSALKKLRRLTINGRNFGDEAAPALAGMTDLVYLDLGITNIADKGMASLEKLTNIKNLGLSYTLITDEGLKHIQGMKRLEQLHLRRTPIKNGGIESLSELTSLTNLNVDESTVTDNFAKEVHRIPHLVNLNLHLTAITDAELQHLGKSKKLKILNLSNTAVTDKGVGKLAAVTSLIFLDVSQTKVTGAALVDLAKIPNLEGLSFNELENVNAHIGQLAKFPKLRSFHAFVSDLTDANLEIFSECKALEVISVQHSSVTKTGVAALKAKCPKLRIQSDPKQ